MARRLIGTVALITWVTLLADLFDLAALPPWAIGLAWAVFMIASLTSLAMDWRSRRAMPQQNDPSPARSALGVIVMTGAVAAVLTIGDTGTAADYVLPAIILAVTAPIAFAAFRFASRNRDRIGEARFETASNGD